MDVLLFFLYLLYLPLSLYTYKHLQVDETKVNPTVTSSLCLKWVMGIMATFGFAMLGVLPGIPLIMPIIRMACFLFSIYVISPESKGHNVMYLMFGKAVLTLFKYLNIVKSLFFLVIAELLMYAIRCILSNNAFKPIHVKKINEEAELICKETQKVLELQAKLDQKRKHQQQPKSAPPNISSSYVFNDRMKNYQ